MTQLSDLSYITWFSLYLISINRRIFPTNMSMLTLYCNCEHLRGSLIASTAHCIAGLSLRFTLSFFKCEQMLLPQKVYPPRFLYGDVMSPVSTNISMEECWRRSHGKDMEIKSPLLNVDIPKFILLETFFPRSTQA